MKPSCVSSYLEKYSNERFWLFQSKLYVRFVDELTKQMSKIGSVFNTGTTDD